MWNSELYVINMWVCFPAARISKKFKFMRFFFWFFFYSLWFLFYLLRFWKKKDNVGCIIYQFKLCLDYKTVKQNLSHLFPYIQQKTLWACFILDFFMLTSMYSVLISASAMGPCLVKESFHQFFLNFFLINGIKCFWIHYLIHIFTYKTHSQANSYAV